MSIAPMPLNPGAPAAAPAGTPGAAAAGSCTFAELLGQAMQPGSNRLAALTGDAGAAAGQQASGTPVEPAVDGVVDPAPDGVPADQVTAPSQPLPVTPVRPEVLVPVVGLTPGQAADAAEPAPAEASETEGPAGPVPSGATPAPQATTVSGLGLATAAQATGLVPVLVPAQGSGSPAGSLVASPAGLSTQAPNQQSALSAATSPTPVDPQAASLALETGDPTAAQPLPAEPAAAPASQAGAPDRPLSQDLSAVSPEPTSPAEPSAAAAKADQPQAAEQPRTLSTATVVSGTGPANPAIAPTAPVAGTAPGQPATPSAYGSAVLDQVLPTVPRMVLRGDGTSQLSLKLHPADLGEVHLTVSVRDKVVNITLSAGPEARAALADGTSQLASMLDAIGHSAGQVTIRDLGGAVVSSTGSSQHNPLGQQTQQQNLEGQLASEQGTRHDGREPGRDGRDGTRADHPHGGATTTRTHDAGRLSPVAAGGVDVTV